MLLAGRSCCNDCDNVQQSSQGQITGDRIAVQTDTEGQILVKQMTVWSVDSIWVSPEKILPTPRLQNTE